MLRVDGVAPRSVRAIVVAVLLTSGGFGCSDESQDEPGPCASENGYLPRPIVTADGQQVQASLGVYDFCGAGGHGDGPLMVGEPAVVLAASGEVVVEVPLPFGVEIEWAGQPFVSHGDGSYVSPGADPGCHRLKIDLTDPASDAVAWYGVDVAMQSAC